MALAVWQATTHKKCESLLFVAVERSSCADRLTRTQARRVKSDSMLWISGALATANKYICIYTCETEMEKYVTIKNVNVWA